MFIKDTFEYIYSLEPFLTSDIFRQNNSSFNAVLSHLETDAECQSLTLYSFLMLPMQRITRLRLLFETMLTLLATDDSEFTACQKTLDILSKVKDVAS